MATSASCATRWRRSARCAPATARTLSPAITNTFTAPSSGARSFTAFGLHVLETSTSSSSTQGARTPLRHLRSERGAADRAGAARRPDTALHTEKTPGARICWRIGLSDAVLGQGWMCSLAATCTAGSFFPDPACQRYRAVQRRLIPGGRLVALCQSRRRVLGTAQSSRARQG